MDKYKEQFNFIANLIPKTKCIEEETQCCEHPDIRLETTNYYRVCTYCGVVADKGLMYVGDIYCGNYLTRDVRPFHSYSRVYRLRLQMSRKQVPLVLIRNACRIFAELEFYIEQSLGKRKNFIAFYFLISQLMIITPGGIPYRNIYPISNRKTTLKRYMDVWNKAIALYLR